MRLARILCQLVRGNAGAAVRVLFATPPFCSLRGEKDAQRMSSTHGREEYDAPKAALATTVDEEEMNLRRLLPKMCTEMRKGSAGRIAVVGGSLEYTGAPFFAAQTALRLGADLAFIYCAPDAATPIKCYSPELIVHPFLGDAQKMSAQLARTKAIVVGPGLGREEKGRELFDIALAEAAKSKIPLIVDADGLFFLSQLQTKLIGKQLERAVLTPNRGELMRLVLQHLGEKLNPSDDKKSAEATQKLAAKLRTTVYAKGPVDCISYFGEQVECVAETGSPRRCGGQGDLLAGALGVFSFWATGELGPAEERARAERQREACRAAGYFVRRLARATYLKMGRSITAEDMVKEIPRVLIDIEGEPTL